MFMWGWPRGARKCVANPGPRLYDGIWLAILFRKVTRYRQYYQRAQATLPAEGAGPE